VNSLGEKFVSAFLLQFLEITEKFSMDLGKEATQGLMEEMYDNTNRQSLFPSAGKGFEKYFLPVLGILRG
jgi:hypothetical protein